MKNKKMGIGIGIIVLLLLVFIGYKTFLIYYFSHDDKEYKEIFSKITDIAINQDTTNQNDNIGNLHYYLPNELSLQEEKNGQKVYVEFDTDGKQIGRLSIGVSHINAFEDTKQSLKFVNYEKLAKKYNIQDEIDLYHYYYNHKDEKRNIFWSSSHIKMNGFVNLYMLIVSSGGSNCNSYFLNKDLKGYMLECSNNNSYDAYFVHDNENYVVSYMGKESTTMSYQEFLKILESISFA